MEYECHLNFGNIMGIQWEYQPCCFFHRIIIGDIFSDMSPVYVMLVVPEILGRASHSFSGQPMLTETQLNNLLVRFTWGMDGLLGVAGMVFDSDEMDSDEMDHTLIPYV